jgi:hypothetical protein
MQYVYSEKLIVDIDKDLKKRAEILLQFPKARKHEYRSLLELWILADKYDMPKLQNEAMRKLIRHCQTPGGLSDQGNQFNFVFKNTLFGPLQKLCVDICWSISPPVFLRYDLDDAFPRSLITQFAIMASQGCRNNGVLDHQLFQSPELFVPEATSGVSPQQHCKPKSNSETD